MNIINLINFFLTSGRVPSEGRPKPTLRCAGRPPSSIGDGTLTRPKSGCAQRLDSATPCTRVKFPPESSAWLRREWSSYRSHTVPDRAIGRLSHCASYRFRLGSESHLVHSELRSVVRASMKKATYCCSW